MLFVRADASSSIGVGHVMRCLSLAEEWLRGQRQEGVTFAVRELPDALAARIEKSGASLERLPDDRVETVVGAAARRGARYAVVDGYHLDKALQAALASKGERTVLVIDDEGESATDAATIVLNQNLHARKELYASRAPRARLLLGPTYALLRSEFRDLDRQPRQGRPRILVTLGGADPLNLTSVVMEALAGIEDVDLEVIVGAANPRANELKATRPDDVFVAVDDMATRMKRADLAIVAAGSTCWELACAGVPMLVFATADNQRSVQASVVERGIGAALHLPTKSGDVRAAATGLLHDATLRLEMSRRGRALVDGKGTTRVVEVLRHARVEEQQTA